MGDYNNIIEGLKTLARGGKLIYRDVVKPAAKGSRRLSKMVAVRKKKRSLKSVWGPDGENR